MAEILSSVQDYIKKTCSAVSDVTRTGLIQKKNQTKIFLNCMKLSILYRSQFLNIDF